MMNSINNARGKTKLSSYISLQENTTKPSSEERKAKKTLGETGAYKGKTDS